MRSILDPIYTMSDFRFVYRNRWKTHPGYQWAFLMQDGETLCFHCAEENLRQLIEAVANPVGYDHPWAPLGIINVSEMEEEGPITCTHCDKILKED